MPAILATLQRVKRQLIFGILYIRINKQIRSIFKYIQLMTPILLLDHKVASSIDNVSPKRFISSKYTNGCGRD